jgi:hypothetical protein
LAWECDTSGGKPETPRYSRLARKERDLATLHIEHPITDLRTWLGAFARFGEVRQKAGVRAQRVRKPVDDDRYIYVDLDFDSIEQAVAFQEFLETNVWASRDASPALGGTPRARVLTDVDTAS